MNGITQGLLAAGCEVRVLSVCSDKHPVLGSRMTEDYIKATHFEAVHVDLGIHLLDAGVSWLCGESYHVKRFISKDFSAKLRDILQEEESKIDDEVVEEAVAKALAEEMAAENDPVEVGESENSEAIHEDDHDKEAVYEEEFPEAAADEEVPAEKPEGEE